MKILIVSVFFPPQNSIASLRPYSWAKYWSQWGHDVTVLTTPKPSLSSNSPLPTDGFRVMEVPGPWTNLGKSKIGKSSADQESLTSATSTERAATGRLPGLLRCWLRSLQARYGILSFCRLPDKHDLWAWGAFPHVAGEKWDAVVSSGGPYSVHIVANRLKRRGLADRWVLDWRDLWTHNHIYPGLPIARPLERYIENVFHQHADVITTVSEPLASILRASYADKMDKVEVIYNGYDPEDYKNLPEERIFPDDHIFRIVFTGTIYAGKQDPTPLFAALHELDRQKLVTPRDLQVVMVGHNADATEIARLEGVEAYVHYAGFVPRENALRMQRDGDALLFLEFEAPGAEGILSGKVFEYLFAGPPIIVVGVGGASSPGRLIEEAGRGRTYGRDAGRVAEGLISLMSSRSLREDAVVDLPKFDLGKFSRPQQAARLLSFISGT